MGFIRFMSSGVGRGVRVVAGIALVALGLFVVRDTWGAVIAALALVPLFAGTFDVCVFAPLFRAPFRGVDARTHTRPVGRG